MINEAVLETRESADYIGLLIEVEEWIDHQVIGSPQANTKLKIHSGFKWRIVDRLSGDVTEGVIPAREWDGIRSLFEETWQRANVAPTARVDPTPVLPTAYLDHPNFGRF